MGGPVGGGTLTLAANPVQTEPDGTVTLVAFTATGRVRLIPLTTRQQLHLLAALAANLGREQYREPRNG